MDQESLISYKIIPHVPIMLLFIIEENLFKKFLYKILLMYFNYFHCYQYFHHLNILSSYIILFLEKRMAIINI